MLKIFCLSEVKKNFCKRKAFSLRPTTPVSTVPLPDTLETRIERTTYVGGNNLN